MVGPSAESKEEAPTVIVADELFLVRDGIAALCQASRQYRVVGTCGDGAAAVRLAEQHTPQLALLDLNLPELFTLEAVRKIGAVSPDTRTIVMSTRKDRKTVVEVLRSGASGYVLKSGPGEHLLRAFEQILLGSIYVSPLLDLEQIFLRGKTQDVNDPLGCLSAREYEVFHLLIEGIRAKEIAARLELSPKTVDTYRASLMRKLDIHDVAGLVKFAIQRNLISTT